MDLEKAYNKIDNFCCSNHNTLQGNKVKYPNGEEEVIDMFSDYQVNKDDDFCKDVYEMTDALETIKDVIDLQKEFGCSLDVFFKVIAAKKVYIELPQFNFNGVYFVNLDFSAQNIFDLGFYVGSFKISFSEYKKTWWLKADKSE